MISLIIPFYNCENTIDKTMEEINSFIKRYNGYIEFLLIDDVCPQCFRRQLRTSTNRLRRLFHH